MVLFSILIQDEKDFDFDKQIFRHYKRMIGMVRNLNFIGGHTLECQKTVELTRWSNHWPRKVFGRLRYQMLICIAVWRVWSWIKILIWHLIIQFLITYQIAVMVHFQIVQMCTSGQYVMSKQFSWLKIVDTPPYHNSCNRVLWSFRIKISIFRICKKLLIVIVRKGGA